MANPRQPIEEDVVVGGTPGAPNGSVPAVPSTDVTLQADPRQQYVAGRQWNWYTSIPQSLPWAVDDVAKSFGEDIYQRMLLDAQVRSVVNVIKAAVLDDGVQIAPAVRDKHESGYAQAKQLADDAEQIFDKLIHALDDVLWDMLDAVPLGNKMAELVFDLDGGRYTLVDLAVKSRESVAFVVDAYMRVLGILGRVPGQPFAVQQGMLLSDIEHTPNLLPRSKFAVLTFRPQNGDPRGTSILRPAFDPWNQKTQLKREFLKYLTQFAGPSLIGFTAPEAQTVQATNPDGSLAYDTNGNPILLTPEDAMLAALEAFANGTATAFPAGALVQAIEMHGNGEAFLNAFDWHDRQIAKAVLNQILATEEGQHQTRAASGTHKDVMDTMMRQLKRPVERMLRDVLAVWLRLNGQESLLSLRPQVSLGSIEQEDVTALWSAAANLRRAGYLHRSQYPALDALLGLPERTPPDADTVSVVEDLRLQDPAGSGINDKGDLGDEDGQNDTPPDEGDTDTSKPAQPAKGSA